MTTLAVIIWSFVAVLAAWVGWEVRCILRRKYSPVDYIVDHVPARYILAFAFLMLIVVSVALVVVA